MKSFRWTCPACKMPNITICHYKIRERHIISCSHCNEPGRFEPEKQRVEMSPGYPPIYISVEDYK